MLLSKNHINKIQKFILTGFMFLNISFIFFVFKNRSLSKIFNLQNLEILYKSNIKRYHYKIFLAALYFSFFLFFVNIFNIFKDQKEGFHENLMTLMLKSTEEKYFDQIDNFKNYIEVCNKNDKKNNLFYKIILFDEVRKKIFPDKKKRNKFVKNFLKLHLFRFFFFFLRFFIFFEFFLMFHFFYKNFFKTNLFDNIFCSISYFVIFSTLLNIIADFVQLHIKIFKTDTDLLNFQKKITKHENTFFDFIYKTIVSVLSFLYSTFVINQITSIMIMKCSKFSAGDYVEVKKNYKNNPKIELKKNNTNNLYELYIDGKKEDMYLKTEIFEIEYKNGDIIEKKEQNKISFIDANNFFSNPENFLAEKSFCIHPLTRKHQKISFGSLIFNGKKIYFTISNCIFCIMDDKVFFKNAKISNIYSIEEKEIKEKINNSINLADLYFISGEALIPYFELKLSSLKFMSNEEINEL